MVSSKKIEVVCWLALGEPLCATKYFPWQLKADNSPNSLFSKACCSLVWFKKTTTNKRILKKHIWDSVVLRVRWIQVTGAQHLLQSWLEMWRERLPPFLQGLWQLVFPPCHIFNRVCLTCKLSPGRQHFLPANCLPLLRLHRFQDVISLDFFFFLSLDDSFVCGHRAFESLRLLRFKGKIHLMQIMFLFHY